jgi:predicted nucleic acid-binding protein
VKLPASPTGDAAGRAARKRELELALASLDKLMARRAFIETSLDLDPAIERARGLSAKHTERLGCRGFDLLHVALALELESEAFLTSDRVQAAVARAEGLEVRVSEPD